ncbi:MAG: tripartite tricarboxylate transporter TctB family protein [Rhodobacteraceae bacterium]|nr:MAG: tripartite tricarboxylate transporter TctB family protein [Paracoccaceae bacterium]
MQRDWPEVWGGLILAIVGIGAALYAWQNYDMGTLRQMGPGFFPVAIGLALCGFGLIIALPAFLRGGEGAQFDGVSLVLVLAAVLVFGLALPRLGLVGASFVTVLIATLPAQRRGWRWRGVLALSITLVTVLIFHVGLRMTLPLWPRLS